MYTNLFPRKIFWPLKSYFQYARAAAIFYERQLIHFVYCTQFLSLEQRARAYLLKRNTRTHDQVARAHTRCIRTGRARGVLRSTQCARLETGLLIRGGRIATLSRF